jgi:predicted N-formylglutamate amidohydrolase
LEASPHAEIAPAEVEAVAIENAEGSGPFVVICDHASNFIPPEYGDLGLTSDAREAHIAWDPGALSVARGVARRLDAPLIYPTVSRLVIDCNRPTDAPDLIPETSEATAIPGNAGLPQSERARRVATFHEPYHHAIDGLIDDRLAAGKETALVAVHSFTPVFHGVARPWEIGIVFDRDRRLADPLIAHLKASGLNVGVNEPYAPADRVYTTMSRHGEARGLAAVMIEIRNDLIVSEAAEEAWSQQLAATLGRSLHPPVS